MSSRRRADTDRQGGRQVDTPERGAREWLTRDEAAAAIGKTPRTVDRLLRAGRLHRIGEGVPVKITKESAERVAGELAEAVMLRRSPVVTIEQASYDAMLLQTDRLASQLKEKETRLLAWEGTIAALEAELAAERQERERLAAELQASIERQQARGFWSLPAWWPGQQRRA